MSRIQIRTPSRLHFGLLGWGERGQRQFGGLGLMIQDPGLELTVEKSQEFEASGPHSARALSFARAVLARFEEQGVEPSPVRIRVLNAPDLHNGLGVGTQLGLAIARAMSSLFDIDGVQTSQLATLTGRGMRSGIGIHGFDEGGLIVDGGRRGDSIPARILRIEFPKTWAILVVNPENEAGLHGTAETQAFRELPPFPERITDRLCGAILLGLVPAIVETDITEFGRSLTEIQETVGQCFAPVQGGMYASPKTRLLVECMRKRGLLGVGQSSWGPALYGFTDVTLDERVKIRSEILNEFEVAEERIFWTCADNQGARLLPAPLVSLS